MKAYGGVAEIEPGAPVEVVGEVWGAGRIIGPDALPRPAITSRA